MLSKRLTLTVSMAALAMVLGIPAEAQKDAAAAQALSRAAAAAGFNPGELTSLSAAGTFLQLDSLQRIPQALSVTVLAPDMVRWELAGPDGTVVTSVTGASGWTRRGDAARGLSAAEAAARGIAFFPLLALGDWISSPRARLDRPTPDAPAGGGPALTRVPVALVPAADGDDDALEALETISRVDLLAETGNGQAAAVELTDRSTGDWRLGGRLRIVFSDHVRVGGALLPRTLTGWRDGSPVWRIHFDSLQVNPPVAAGDFLP